MISKTHRHKRKIITFAVMLSLVLAAFIVQRDTRLSSTSDLNTQQEDLSLYLADLDLQHHHLLRAVTQYVNRSGLISKLQLNEQLNDYKNSLINLDTHLTSARNSIQRLDSVEATAPTDQTESAHTIHQRLITAIETLLHNGDPTLQYSEVLIDWIKPGDFTGLSEIGTSLYALGDDITNLQLAAIDYIAYIDGVRAALGRSLQRQLMTSYFVIGTVLLVLLALLLMYLRNRHQSAIGLQQMNINLQKEIEASSRLATELEFQATHDALSGLLNRRGFCDELNHILDTRKTSHGLCFIDLDLFKIVNDTAGHSAGDELIRQIATALTDAVEYSGASVARFGGDEFLILIPDCTDAEFRQCITHASAALSPYAFSYNEKSFSITGSFGAIHFPADEHTEQSLFAVVDTACYVAKNSGGGRVHYCSDDNSVVEIQQNVNWIARINDALQNDKFCLYFQPIVNTPSQSGSESSHGPYLAHSWEVLLRMLDDDGSVILPGAFLATAERYSLATDIDRWVVTNTLQWLHANSAVLDEIKLININLSGKTIGDESFLQHIEHLVSSLSIPPGAICFEITETAAVGDGALEFLLHLKDLGFMLALDDFGSGFSSFGYLEKLPVDYIKLDGRFVRDIDSNATHKEFVRAINAVGKVMNKLTVAEFLENAESLEVLRELGVDFVQGYHVARPEPLPDYSQQQLGLRDAA